MPRVAPDGWEIREVFGSGCILARWFTIEADTRCVAILDWRQDANRYRPFLKVRVETPESTSLFNAKTVSGDVVVGKRSLHRRWSVLCDTARTIEPERLAILAKKMLRRHEALTKLGFKVDNYETYIVPDGVNVDTAAKIADKMARRSA